MRLRDTATNKTKEGKQNDKNRKVPERVRKRK